MHRFSFFCRARITGSFRVNAARDGTYKELQLTDEQLQELIKKTEALEDAPDDL